MLDNSPKCNAVFIEQWCVTFQYSTFIKNSPLEGTAKLA